MNARHFGGSVFIRTNILLNLLTTGREKDILLFDILFFLSFIIIPPFEWIFLIVILKYVASISLLTSYILLIISYSPFHVLNF